MNGNLVSVALLTVGGLLLWAAIADKKPLPAVKALLGGEGNMDEVPSVSGASYTPEQGPGTGESKNGGVTYA